MSTLRVWVSINLNVIRSYIRPAGTLAYQKRWRFQPRGAPKQPPDSCLHVFGFLLVQNVFSLFASFFKMFCWLFTCNHSAYCVTVNIVLFQLQYDHRFSSCGQTDQVCHLSSASGSIQRAWLTSVPLTHFQSRRWMHLVQPPKWMP